MANNRIYYATQKVGIKPNSTPDIPYHTIKGVQSVGMATNFNLEQVFQIGQQALYENIEEIPDVEVTLTKVLDGCHLMYLRATEDSTTPELSNKGNRQCMFGLGIYSDSVELAAGTPETFVQCSGMYISAVSYTFSLDDNFSEDVTLVGNNKVWKDDPRVLNPSDQI